MLTMKNSLEALFGSRERWRLIKMFLLNSEEKFTNKEVAFRNKVDGRKIAGILVQLVKAGFLNVQSKDAKEAGRLYFLNKKFSFVHELKTVVIKSNLYPQCESLGKIRSLGEVQLSLISGVFVDNSKSKTDLLIVGDLISKAKMKHLLEDLEAEMGREINYSLMSTSEFKYRVNMFDKFITELLEAPHEIILNNMQKEVLQMKRNKKS
jgi:predicted transcriptional regulator